jgi:hypothetical protein
MANRKRPRTADHDPPPPTRKSPRVRTSARQATLPPPSQAKSSRVRTSTRQATLPPPSQVKSSGVRTSTRQATLPPPSQAKSSGVRTSTRQATSTSARGKSSIIPTPTETPSITTPDSHDASDAGNSHGSNTLNGKELVLEALKIVNNPASAELMILELINKYSFDFPHLKELLSGKPSPFCYTKSLLGLTTD